MKSAIVTNGYISNYFSISRGIRQGDSLSALLYILQIEPLAEYLRNTKDFKGIEIVDKDGVHKEVKVGQFVDDMEVFLKNVSQIDKCL